MSTNPRRVFEEELTTDGCPVSSRRPMPQQPPSPTKLVSGYSSTTDSGFLSGHLSSTDDMRVSREIRSHSSGFGVSDSDNVSLDDLNDKSRKDVYLRQDSGYIDRFSQLDLSESCDNLEKVPEPVVERPQPGWLEKVYQQAFSQDEDGDTYLHVAIADGFIEAVFSLVRLAPNPKYIDIRNNCWHTPLHIAVLMNQPLIVRRLVLAGASTYIRDKWGNTPLHYAAERGDVNCVLNLLSQIDREEIRAVGGSPHRVSYQGIDIKNYQGQTSAHLAARNGHLDVLKHLWSFGANMNSREGLGGRTPLHFAVQNENTCVADLLLSYCKVDAETENYAGLTPYQQAILCNLDIKHDLVRLGSLTKEVKLVSSSDESDEEDMDSDFIYSSMKESGTPVMTTVSG